MEATSLAPGYRLDRYELLCPIASGGMATVWLARLRGKRGFEKLFAIKTIKTELITDPRYQEMFLDEARIASGIEHPNVAQILDLGEQDDNLYIVMEWVDGESLAKLARLALRKKKLLPLEIILRLMADACAGLHAAHELADVQGHNVGIVHRDVSPQNLLVTVSGALKVIDFGVAKARTRSAGDTQSGVVKGKIRYMAPEQVNAKAVDRRADVWALGTCLHELMNGRPPYHELADLDVVRHLMTEDPTPRFDPDLAPALKRVLTRSLARDPQERFATAAAMRRAIESAIEELDLNVTSEDVADYVRQNFPELEKTRRETIAKAVEASQARTKDPASSQQRVKVDQPEEIALAPTMVDEVPLTKRKPSPQDAVTRVNGRSLLPDEAKSTGGATLTEQLGPRPKSKTGIVFVVALATIGLGGWFVWPGADRIRAATSRDPAIASASASSAVTSASAPPVDSSDVPPPVASVEPEPPPASSIPVVTPESLPPLPAHHAPRLAPVMTAPGGRWVAIRNDAGVIEWVAASSVPAAPASAPAPPASASAAPAPPPHPAAPAPANDN